MLLMQLGPVMFGGTPGIIQFLRSKGLLAQSKMCGRYIYNPLIFFSSFNDLML